MGQPYQVMPPLSSDEYAELKADILARGVLVPVEYDEEGNILDGYHRVQACQELGVTDWPRVTRLGLSETGKLTHARQLNLARRHLDREARRSLIAQQLRETPQLSNRQIAESLGVDHKTVATARSELESTGEIPQLEKTIGADGRERTTTPERPSGYRFHDTSPEGREAVLLSAKEVRELRNAENRERHDEQGRAAAALPVPAGKYRVIVIDPPWPVEKYERDVRPNQSGGLDYPTMTHEKIAAFDVGGMAADDGCHLFCWTTQKHLPATLDIVERWGFTYCLVMVWHKPGGPQPFGLPQYNCEFVVYARRAAPEFLETKAFFTCFEAPRREHSRKPDEFYDLIRRVTAGPRIDVFSRELRDGFGQFGDEKGKFAA